jgi:hypothetical protein
MPEDAPLNSGAPGPETEGSWVRVSEMQAKLHRWAVADPGRRFDDLFNFVHDPATLREAYWRVAGNRGANTPGVDGMTVALVEERIGVPEFLDGLRAELKQGTFAPQVTLRVARIGIDKQLVETPDSLSVQPPERLQQPRNGPNGPSRRETLGDGLPAELLGSSGIHETGIQIAELPLLAAIWCRRGLFHDLAHRFFSLVGQNLERAIASPIRGDLSPRQPPPGCVPEQVVLRADSRIELVHGDTGGERHAS